MLTAIADSDYRIPRSETQGQLLGFVIRIRRIRRIMTPLGFTTRQITNAYVVHEPKRGLGLLATLVFATESNCWTASAHVVESEGCEGKLNPTNSLHQALLRLGRALGSNCKSGPAGGGGAFSLATAEAALRS
jgi:hypothetical protein